MTNILVDADACPVKDEIYRVALRHDIAATLIANRRLRVPNDPRISQFVVDDHFDAADDMIVKIADANTIVVTADILLAARAIAKGAACLAPNGTEYTDASIGNAVAMRALMADLRAGGKQIGGPKPFSARDRSQFLQALDRVIVKLSKKIT